MGHTVGHTNLTTPVTSDTIPVHTPYPQVQVIPKGFTEDCSVLTPQYTINTIAHWGTLISPNSEALLHSDEQWLTLWLTGAACVVGGGGYHPSHKSMRGKGMVYAGVR
jgi:hypothetical protein